ncbi:M96 mating-specific protein family, partial [Phytophthora palmivora]
MPPARRQTRQELEAFMARLEGRDSVARYRLLRERKAYLDGERDEDADFGDDAAPSASKRSAVKKKNTPQKPPLTKKPVVRKQKKMTKKEEADIVRRDKAAKKARAVQHVEATTALRAAANEKERDRILQEEKDGVNARIRALTELKRRRAGGRSAAEKKRRKTSTTTPGGNGEAIGNESE